MSIYKFTFKFNQTTVGFSESIYADFPDLATAAEAAETLAQFRATLLAVDVSFEAVEVVADSADAAGSYFNDDALLYPSTSLPGDVTAAGSLVQINGQRGYHRSLCLRGLPDAWVERVEPTGKLRLTPIGAEFVDDYLEQVATGELFLKVRLRTNDGGGAVRISGARAALNDPKTTELDVPATWPFPLLYGPVIISGGRRTVRALNGTHRVVALVDATTIRIGLPFGIISGYEPNDAANLMIRTPTLEYIQIVDAVRTGIRTHKTGRAFFVPRGRQPNRAR